MGITPCTDNDINILDNMIAARIKKAEGLSISASTALTREDEEAQGLGCTSLKVDYATTNAHLLQRGLNSEGRMGVTTRALLDKQISLFGHCKTATWQQAKYCMRVRQLSLATESDLTLVKDKIPQYTSQPAIMSALRRLNPYGEGSTPCHIPCTFLQPLFTLGIQHLGDLLEANGTHIINGNTLKLKYGRRVRGSHIASLNRLARLLNSGPGRDFDMTECLRRHDTTLTTPHSDRRIHPGNAIVTAMAPPSGAPDTIPFPTTRPAQDLIEAYLTRTTRQHRPQPTPQQPQENHEEDSPREGTKRHRFHRDPVLHRTRPKKQRRCRTCRKQTCICDHPHPSLRKDTTSLDQPLNPALQHSHCPCTTHTYKEEKAAHLNNNPAPGYENCPAAVVMQQMFGSCQTILRITGWRLATNNDIARDRKGKRRHDTDLITQSQFQVQWAPTRMERWALKYHAEAGYHPSGPPISCAREDMVDEEATCEVCWSADSIEHKRDADNHDDMLTCDSCNKIFHVACLGKPRGWRCTTEEWKCPPCMTTPPPADDIVMVNWQSSWEEGGNLAKSDAAKAMIEDYIRKQRDQPAPKKPRPAPDADMTNLQKQGQQGAPAWRSSMGSALRQKIKILHEPVDPMLDIQPTGEYRIEIKNVQIMQGAVNMHASLHALPALTNREAAVVYAPDGRALGAITVERLRILRQAYLLARASGKHQIPGGVQTFEAEVAALLIRYRSSIKARTLGDAWSAPPQFADPPHTRIINKIRNASPLCIPYANTIYWSKHERDGVFNASKGQPLSMQWRGFSSVLCPPDAAEQEKYVRWALLSTADAQPTATLLLLPHKARMQGGSKGYNRWVEAHPEHCHKLAEVRGTLPFSTDLIMTRGLPYASSPRLTHMDVLIVWNDAAKEALQPDMEEWANNLHPRAPTPPPNHQTVRIPTAARSRNPHPPPLAPHHTFRKALTERHLVLNLAPPPDVEESIRRLRVNTSPPMYNWKEISYTDGSCRKDDEGRMRIGAAVYTPQPREGQPQCCLIDPAGAGATHAINRAELAGVWGSIHNGDHITATDSATTLRQIQKAILHPNDLKFHKYRDALELILKEVQEHPAPTITLLKVKAHSSLPGNEMADRGAKQAATSEAHDLTFPADPTPGYLKGGYWFVHEKALHLATVTEDPTMAEQTELEENGAGGSHKRPNKRQRATEITNMQGSLRAHMHRLHRLGKANQDSIYYRAWQSITPLIKPDLNNRIHKSLEYRVRHNVNRYRFGILWSAKLAYRNGDAHTPACPLCGGMDGSNHIAGGCQHDEMRRMYQETHNTLGRIILKATAKGNLGNNIACADLGSADKCKEDGAPVIQHRTVPPDMLPLPQGATPEETQKHTEVIRKLSRPDMLLTFQHQDTRRKSAIIVDLKTCSDTQPAMQLEKCFTQHHTLAERLRQSGYDVRTLPILVGHSGTIYTQHTLMSLETLGISKLKAEKCAHKLGTTACRLLDSIIRTRQRLVFAHQSSSANMNRPPRPP